MFELVLYCSISKECLYKHKFKPYFYRYALKLIQWTWINSIIFGLRSGKGSNWASFSSYFKWTSFSESILNIIGCNSNTMWCLRRFVCRRAIHPTLHFMSNRIDIISGSFNDVKPKQRICGVIQCFNLHYIVMYLQHFTRQ